MVFEIIYFLKNIFITLNWILSIGHPSEQTDDIMDLESQNVLKARVNNISAEKGYTFLFLFLGQIEEREREYKTSEWRSLRDHSSIL